MRQSLLFPPEAKELLQPCPKCGQPCRREASPKSLTVSCRCRSISWNKDLAPMVGSEAGAMMVAKAWSRAISGAEESQE